MMMKIMMKHEYYNSVREYSLWILNVIVHKLQIPAVSALCWGDAGIQGLLQLGVHGGKYFMVF